MARTILIILLIMLLLGMLPVWGLHGWGYGPSGGFGVILFVLIILILADKL